MDLASLIFQLVLDTSASWMRMFVALFFSIAISIAVGIWMATSRRVEKFLLPVLDIFQTLPILTFFPLVILLFVNAVPGYAFIGVNAAVVFLIITSMIWNMIFGVYESIKTMPHEFFEVAELYNLNLSQKLKLLFIPGSMSRLIEQSVLSWSIGLFYLVTSEIFSTGQTQYQVTYGIGSALLKYAPGPGNPTGNLFYYGIAIAIFIAFVIMTRFLFFRPLEEHFRRYKRNTSQQQNKKAKVTRYEKGVERWLSMHFGYTKTHIKIGPLNVRYVSLRERIQKSRRVMHRAEKRLDERIVYGFVAILLVAYAAYYAYFNRYVIGYEAQVLSALSISIVRVWLAFFAIVCIAVPVSIYLVFISKQSGKYLLAFQILASIPATVLLPLIAVGLHNPELVAFVIFFLSGLWYVIFSMLSNGNTIPSTLFDVKKVFGVRGNDAWRKIYLKALIPGLITGGLTAVAAEWNASIVAEYFTYSGLGGSTAITSVQLGIGKLLDTALTANNITLMVLAIINMVAMILIINTFVWKRFYKNVSKIYR